MAPSRHKWYGSRPLGTACVLSLFAVLGYASYLTGVLPADGPASADLGGQTADGSVLLCLSSSPPSRAKHELAQTAEGLTRMRLTSTLVGRTFRSAVIDGRSVQVGDRVGPGLLAAIYPRHVILNYQDAEYRLNMRQ